MKKLLLVLIANFLLGLTAHAQADVYAKSSMVVMVSQAQKDFVKGTSYQDWKIKQIDIEHKPSVQEEKLLKEVYGFLSTQARPDSIYKSYSGTSMAELGQFERKAGVNMTGSSDPNRNWWWFLIRKIMDIYIELFIDLP